MKIQAPEKMTASIKIKLTPSQYERIKFKAKEKGYVSVAQFIRHLALEKDALFDNKFNYIYETILKLNNNINKKKNENKQEGYLI